MTPMIRRFSQATAAAAAALVVLPVAAAVPAQAATFHDAHGCTVVIHAPTHHSTASNGVKQINYGYSTYCAPDRAIIVEQRRYEQDSWPNQDDHTGTTTESWHWTDSGAHSVVKPLPDTEPFNEEIYHKVRFRVITSNGFSAWSPWLTSSVRVFSN